LSCLASPTTCKMWVWEQSRLHVLGTIFFRKWGQGGGAGSWSEPRGPRPTPGPTAAPGGAGWEGGALHRPYKLSACTVAQTGGWRQDQLGARSSALPGACGAGAVSCCRWGLGLRAPAPSHAWSSVQRGFCASPSPPVAPRSFRPRAALAAGRALRRCC
jgi:hypothetical protein